MRLIAGILITIFLYSCNNSLTTDGENGKDSIKTEKKLIQITNDSVMEPPFWIISVGAYKSADSASLATEKLLGEGKKASYLWIPDYSTLSGKEYFSVFLGPYYSESDAGKDLAKYKKDYPGSYAVKADHEGSRMSLYSSFDIRKNDKRMYMVLIYATPADQEAYANEGGEDWGWFVSDVGTYLAQEADDLYYGSLYDSWFSDEEIKAIEKELNLSGFGYILIKGNDKSFVEHNTPDDVISSICDFFGKDYNAQWMGGE